PIGAGLQVAAKPTKPDCRPAAPAKAGAYIRFSAYEALLQFQTFGGGMIKNMNEARRRFLAHFACTSLGATFLPCVLWMQIQQSGEPRITAEMLKTALAISGLDFTDTERNAMIQTVNRSLSQYEDLHKFNIPNNVSPPFHFNALVPGMKVNRRREPMRL